MKKSNAKFRSGEISLLLIVIVCATVLVLSWQRTPLPASLFPPDNGLLSFSQDLSVGGLFFSSTSSFDLKPEDSIDSDNTEDSPVRSSPDSSEPGVENIETPPDLAEPVTSTGTTESSVALVEGGSNVGLTEGENEDGAWNSSEVVEVEKYEQSVLNQNPEMENETNLAAPPIVSDDSSSSMSENKACNYAKGKWVVNDSRPLYSGLDCKRWLPQMWACRLMQRTDFSYERLKWEPKGCQMEEFEGTKFLERMRNKTLAFIGDSLGRQQFLSLMCMVTSGQEAPDVIDVGEEYGFVTPIGTARPNGWAYRFTSTNTTILYHWSACLCDLEPINITDGGTAHAMHLDRPPAFLAQFLHKIDVLVLNTGHHWNRGKMNANHWIMYTGGKPNSDRKLARIGDAKTFTIQSIVNWVNSQLPTHPHLKAFYRTISPRHFVNGDWNTGGGCDNTTPMSIGKEVLEDETSDHSAGSAVKGTGVKLLDITALSQVRDEGHISRFSITASEGVQDCLHWCLPGVPDSWNEILFTQISDMQEPETE